MKGDSPDFAGFIPYFSKIWEEGKQPVSYEKLSEISTNHSYNSLFRAFVIDMGLRVNNDEGRKSKKMLNALHVIIQDESENARLRRFAVMNLLDVGEYKNGNNESILLKVFKNERTPSEVKGALLTAMGRTGDPNLNNTIKEVLHESHKYSNIVKRHAVITAAKRGLAVENLDKIKIILEETNDPEVYASSIYALGLTEEPEAIKIIVDNYDKFNNSHIGDNALEKNKTTITNMLKTVQSVHLVSAGIKAATILKFEEFLPSLEQLQYSEVIDKQTLENIINEIKVDLKQSNPKWEVD